MIQPIDRNSLKCVVVLGNDNPQRIEIPIIEDLCETELMVETNTDGYGRIYKTPDIDITFTSQQNEFEGLFNKIIDRFRLYGWSIEVGLEIFNDNYLLFKLNMSVEFDDIETDMQYYFNGKFYINEIDEIIDDKEDTEIDLLSTNSLDKTVSITPIELEDIVTRFKAISTINTYKAFGGKELEQTTFPVQISSTNPSSYNSLPHVSNIIKYNEIELNSNNIQYSPTEIGASGEEGNINGYNYSNFSYFSFKPSTTTNVEFKINNISFRINKPPFFNIDLYSRYVYLAFVIEETDLDGNRISITEERLHTIFSNNYNDIFLEINNEVSIKKQINVPSNRNIRIYLVLATYLEIESISSDPAYRNKVSQNIYMLKNPNLIIQLEDIYSDTTTKASRFINIGEQIIKSITNNRVVEFKSPTFKQGVGNYNFKDVFCTNGSYLRRFSNVKFVAKFKEWKETLRYLFNSDYEVYKGKIFVGHYTEFRTDKEIYKINYNDNTNKLLITFNQRIQKSNIKIEYNKYEDDETNTKEVVHSECNFSIRGTKLNDLEVDIQIPYIADTIQIETTRRESFDKDSTKSTREDDDLYIIDCYEGTYNNAPRIINRRAELFDVAEGIYSVDTSYNLRFTLKRLLIDIYNEIIAETTQYVNRDDLPKLTLQYYKNNVPLRLKPIGGTNLTSTKETTENVDIIKSELNKPKVKGLIYEIVVGRRFKFNEWQELVHNLFTDRGYVTFYDDEIEIKIYPIEMKYLWYREQLTIKGELKYD
jgi:hypothetical protein